MDRSKVLAFVTRQGSPLFHTAILAGSMNVPALFGVEGASEWHGKTVIVDGKKVLLYIEQGSQWCREWCSLGSVIGKKCDSKFICWQVR